MHKKILLVEQSDATRGVAETLLRQNGFDVVGVSSADRAMEVLKFGHPDLIVVGSELMLSGKPFYQHLSERDDAARLKLIVIHDSNDSVPSVSNDIVITRPFDPRVFLQKIQECAGGSVEQVKSVTTEQSLNPLGGASLDDEFLDAALGLDGIEVTDSEVMDKTIIPSKRKTESDEMVGMSEIGENTGMSDSSRVESVMVTESNTDIRQGKKKTAQPASGTGKLDILDDQFGLVNPQDTGFEPEVTDHDYAWFVGEMQKEDTVDKSDQEEQKVDKNLTFVNTTQMVDPITNPTGNASSKKPTSDGGGVEKFIDEFKKEVEKFQAEEPESVTLQPEDSLSQQWEDSIEAVSTEQVHVFTKEFADSLAEKIAEKIVAKIDADKLLRLIKSELIKRNEQG